MLIVYVLVEALGSHLSPVFQFRSDKRNPMVRYDDRQERREKA